MTLVLRGDFSKLGRWQRNFVGLKTQLHTLNTLLAEETIELIKTGFELGQDPYGKKWASLVLRSGRPLQDTGGLKNSWNYTASSSGFTVGSGKKYAAFHQSGTGLYGPHKKRIRPKRKKALRLGKSGLIRSSVKGSPARKMVPEGEIPASWMRAYQEVADEFFKSQLRK